MTGEQALRELLDVSEDVVAAVIFDAEGQPAAASVGDEEARAAAEVAAAMLAYANALRTGARAVRLQAVTADGCVFVVQEATGAIVAVTEQDPVAGLVYHDLRAALRKLGPRRREKTGAAS